MSKLLDLPIYGLTQREKENALLSELAGITRHHRKACPDYARILDALGTGDAFSSIEDIPFLPVSLFKTHRLASVPDGEVFKVLTSSGTTGQAVSHIFLDKETANLQTRALVKIMSTMLGPARMPMILADAESVLRDRNVFSARAAGIKGMMTFGRSHFFALYEDMSLDVDGLKRFLADHASRRILLFGFTFMIWKYFAPAVEKAGIRLNDAILIHSGGWKKLTDEAVDTTTFKRRIHEMTGIGTIRDFYGMAEQVGSVFIEGDDGFLHPPAFADVIIRDPVSLAPLPLGKVGVAQVISVLPRSYPGHSLLTEDMAVVHSVDGDGTGFGGKAFSVLGRIPKSELRGCSDTYAAGRGL